MGITAKNLALEGLKNNAHVGPGEVECDFIRTMEDASLGHAYTYGKCGALAPPPATPPAEVYKGGSGCGDDNGKDS